MKPFKSKRVGSSPSSPGGQRELKTQESGFTTQDVSTIREGPPSSKLGEICSNEIIDNRITTDDFRSFTVYGPPDWLKPGVILKASSFVDGTEVIEERYDRSPITIATTARGQIKSSVIVQNPRAKSSINEAIRQLVSQNQAVSGASMSFNYHEIHSLQELSYKMTGRFSASFANIGAQLGVSSYSEKSFHYYLIEFKQTLFSLEVDGLDKERVFINDPTVPTEDYVYLSKVNYGRIGYLMYVTQNSLESFGVSASARASGFGVSAAIAANITSIQSSSDLKINGFYYGGTIESASRDLVGTLKGTNKNLETYIRASNFSTDKAYPISYELKNLSNEKIGMSSHSIISVKTCVPAKVLKLKVTLSEIQSETTSDSDKYADFTVIQKVLYTTKGRTKRADSGSYRTYGGACNPDGWWPQSVPLICGSRDKQIHVPETKIKGRTRIGSSNNINNSVVFHVTAEEANDPNAKFLIRTYVRENNSSNDVLLNHDHEIKEVAIKDVLAILSGVRSLQATQPYADGSLYSHLRFDNFTGLELPLTRAAGTNTDKMILEGAIRARNKGSKVTDKAYLWMRFELID